MTHNLKTWPCYFEEVRNGFKPFEIRKNDRNFEVGDLLVLEEFDPDATEEVTMADGDKVELAGSYTGRTLERRIIYITDFAQQPGWVVMSLLES